MISRISQLRDPVPPADNKDAEKDMDRKAAYWFAVHARSRHEKQVDSFLKEKWID